MTWSRITATGRGKLRFRLSIDGCQYEPVTDIAMARTVTADNNRVRVVGLNRKGLKDEWESMPERGTVKAKGFTASIADPKGTWRSQLLKLPQAETWLDTDVSTSATTVVVKHVAGFSAGAFHLGTEALTCTSATTLTGGTSGFFGCTRGIWNTVPQAHFAGDGEKLTYAEVLDRPRTLEGRLARLYAYGDGDDPQGDGEQVFLGVVATEPAATDPVNLEITIDHINRILEQPLGADLGDDVEVTGIYRPFPFNFRLWRGSNGYGPGDLTGNRGSFQTAVGYVSAGFWTDQAAWGRSLVAALDTANALFTATYAWTTPGFIVEGDDDGYRIGWKSDGQWSSFDTTPFPKDKLEGHYFNRCEYVNGEYFPGEALPQSNGVQYFAKPEPLDTSRPSGRGGDTTGSGNIKGVRTVPRGYHGYISSDPATTPPSRLYLNSVPDNLTDLDYCFIDWGTEGGEVLPGGATGIPQYRISAASSASRYIETWPVEYIDRFYTSENIPKVKFARLYASGHLGNLVSNLATNAPASANRGAYPNITTAAVSTSAWVANVGAVATYDYLSNREWASNKPLRLDKVLQEGCKLLGMTMTTDANGKIIPKRMVMPSASDPTVATLTAGDIVMSTGWPRWEPNHLGALHSVLCSPNYDPATAKHTEPAIYMIDQRAKSKNPVAQTLKCTPYGHYPGKTPPHAEFLEYFKPTLRLFGNAYQIIDIVCTLKHAISPAPGDPIKLTCPHIPDWTAGTLGVTALPCIVLARTREWDRGLVRLRLMALGQRVYGYTPSLGINSLDSGTDGTTGPFTYTVSLSDPEQHISSTNWEENSNAITDYYATSYRVQIRPWNRNAGSYIAGTVSDVTASTITITWDSAVTHQPEIGTYYWVIDYARSSDASLHADQQPWAWFADETYTFDLVGATANARKYG